MCDEPSLRPAEECQHRHRGEDDVTTRTDGDVTLEKAVGHVVVPQHEVESGGLGGSLRSSVVVRLPGEVHCGRQRSQQRDVCRSDLL